jgi:hypothetical protein
LKSEVGPVVVPNEPDYAAAKDGECGKKEEVGKGLKWAVGMRNAEKRKKLGRHKCSEARRLGGLKAE